ncbi:hypothetical protein QTP88_013065 [Uroleucon formosanum]
MPADTCKLGRLPPREAVIVPSYQKLCVRGIHIRDTRRGQPTLCAMSRPHPGGTAYLITVDLHARATICCPRSAAAQHSAPCHHCYGGLRMQYPMIQNLWYLVTQIRVFFLDVELDAVLLELYHNLQKQSVVRRTLTSTCLTPSAGGIGTITESDRVLSLRCGNVQLLRPKYRPVRIDGSAFTVLSLVGSPLERVQICLFVLMCCDL